MQVNWESIRKAIAGDFPQVRALSTVDLAKWFDDPHHQSPVVFDVRARAEYDVSHLKGAIHAPDAASIIASLKESQDDASKSIVVYCSVGYRSAKVADELRSLGYANIFNLNGSIFQWANEGRPVYRTTNAAGSSCRETDEELLVDEVHPFNRRWGKLLVRANV